MLKIKFTKTLDEYSFQQVKRRNAAICKYCYAEINKGDYANIIECEDYFSGLPNVIAITCLGCTDEFIKNDMNKNNKAEGGKNA